MLELTTEQLEKVISSIDTLEISSYLIYLPDSLICTVLIIK
ncbi:hypothetical protein [Aliarcobacter skirrowii]|nr:hypothetical protein [Aliarcobacter skirrowii]